MITVIKRLGCGGGGQLLYLSSTNCAKTKNFFKCTLNHSRWRIMTMIITTIVTTSKLLIHYTTPALRILLSLLWTGEIKFRSLRRSSSSSMHTDDNINNHCANILSRHYYNEEDSPIYYYYYLAIQEWESNTLQGCPLSQPQIILFFFQEFADLQ